MALRNHLREVFRLQMLRHLRELLACWRVRMRQALPEVRQLGGIETCFLTASEGPPSTGQRDCDLRECYGKAR